MTLFFRVLIFSSVLAAGCDHNSDTLVVPGPAGDSLHIVEAFPSLDFNRPVDLQNYGDDNLFVVEQRGVIQVFHNDPDTESAAAFLDIRSVVDDRDNEEGLLGLAFHPGYLQNGYFYVNYTTSHGTTRISRFEVDVQNPTVAVPSSEFVLMEFTQPFGNHNGGQLAFGPDGYLYIAVGDGGSGGDPQGNGQNTSTLLGSILRIDIDNPTENLNYGIPTNNPFAGNQSGAREEIFAYGLRNPWRFHFDSTGDLYIADVGQDKWEEIDVVPAGELEGMNFGWNVMEGNHCFRSRSCETVGLAPATVEYDHKTGCSVTGGEVYRGKALPQLTGLYIYADYCTAIVRSFMWRKDGVRKHWEWKAALDPDFKLATISSFGHDVDGELYMLSLDGDLYKFVPAD